MSYFRKISPAEATHLAKDLVPNGQFVNQFFIEGYFNDTVTELNVQQWQKAVDLAAQANPSICLGLGGYWGFRYWKRVQQTPKVLYVESAWNGSSSEHFNTLAPFINPRTDNTASIILIKPVSKNNEVSSTSKHKIFILFRIHHGICDGAATAHWIQEVFRALRGEILLGSVSTLNELAIVKRTSYPKPSVFRGRCLPMFPVSSTPHVKGCHWIKTNWQHNEQRIVAKLLFVLRKIALEQHGQGRTVFRLTSDLRHYLTEQEKQTVQFSNLSGIFDLEVKDTDSVKSIQFSIIKALRKHNDLSVYPKRMLALVPWLPSSMLNIKPKGEENLHQRGICNITAMIGYANHIDLNAVSYQDFTAQHAYAIPMAIPDKSIFMSIASSPNGIAVIISAPNALSTINNSFALSQRIDTELAKLN